MKAPDITIGQLKQFLKYFPETGDFVWIAKPCRRINIGRVACYRRSEGYGVISLHRRRYRSGRLAWFYMMGVWPTGDIDHIDGNPRNDRFENLRDVSTAGNIQNQKIPHLRNVTGGYLGVSQPSHFRKYRARICVEGKTIWLGYHDTPEQAHQAYLEAKRAVHSTCTI